MQDYFHYLPVFIRYRLIFFLEPEKTMFFQGEHHLLHLLHGTGHNGSLESLVVGDS